MKKVFLYLIILTLLIGCKSQFSSTDELYQSVEITTIMDEKISIRPIIADGDKLWFAADKSRFGYYNLKTGVLYQSQIKNDSLKLEFRSIAQTAKHIFITNVGNPAYFFRISKDNLMTDLVYTEAHEKVFYDSMKFWNDNEGIAIGDPITDCLSILVTRNGGATWKKIPCENLPKTVEGEAAFAASNTNISISGNNTWIVSGGKKSRVFFSHDKGNSWQVFDTPIVQGEPMTGIFTADFYNDTIGIVAGGNYEVLSQNFQNKAITLDGGKTWTLIAENQGFGYSSCIQFVPKSNGKQIVSVGALGLHYSSDGGYSWKQFSKDDSLYTIRFVNKKLAFAAGRNKIVKIEFKK